jgi:hypothetical protein
MQFIEIVLAFLPLVLIVVALVWYQHSSGPFCQDHYRGQFVYRIVVRDQAGVERAGWIRIGSWLAGVLSGETKVIWDP